MFFSRLSISLVMLFVIFLKSRFYSLIIYNLKIDFNLFLIIIFVNYNISSIERIFLELT